MSDALVEKTVHTIVDATWTRYGKWRVELEIVGEAKSVHWLTPAQYDFLASAFSHTRSGYSDKRCRVVGLFSSEGRYVRCKAVAVPPRPRHFTPLVEEGTADASLLDTH